MDNLNKATCNLLKENGIIFLDIGARFGVSEDLAPIAGAVEAVGFEPDIEECKRLNLKYEAATTKWKSLRFLPIALGNGQDLTLNLYRQRGCSSLLKANVELARQFCREDYYVLEDQIKVSTITLDDAATQYGFKNATALKIDIQGAELDVFNSGKNLLTNNILSIRTEISFLPVYFEQPLLCDIDKFLHPLGFIPLEFSELHSWRRDSLKKTPYLSSGMLPYSKGQLVHGDVLYVKNLECIPSSTDFGCHQLVDLALISLCYGHVDYAQMIISKKHVKEYILDNSGKRGVDSLREMVKSYSYYLARKHRKQRLRQNWNEIIYWLLNYLKLR